jgi:hypothetical protein
MPREDIMKIPASMASLTVKALAESLTLENMKIIADKLFDYYDFNKKTGFSYNLDIPRQVAAKQFVSDVKNEGLFIKLVQILIEMHTTGYMGKKYPIKYLKEIISNIREQGIIYDIENHIFVEDPAIRKTKNWGALNEGEQYLFALLRLDIAGNSKLVREYPDDIIQATYADFRDMVYDAVDRRNGRIWSWEGDGGLVAFFFSNKNLYATFAGMDIVNRLFLYNLTKCRLKEPLGVRIAVHSGLMDYTDKEEDLKRSDIIRTITDIEANYTKPNTLTISDMVAKGFCKSMLEEFKPVTTGSKTYYNYSLQWEAAE